MGLIARSLAILSILSTLCSATMVVQHLRSTVPSGFVQGGPALSSESITIRMALASTNMDGLQQKLLTISDPANSEYGQWLTKDEVY